MQYYMLDISTDLFQSSSVLAYSCNPQCLPIPEPFPSPAPGSKAQKRTSVQPARVARQLKSRNPTLQAPR